MKKKLVFGASICIVCVVLALIIYKYNSDSRRSQGTSSNDFSDILMKSFPTDIVVYGSDLPFDEGIEYRCVDSLNKTTLSKKKQFQIVILSDFDGKLEISDEEFDLLKEMVFSGESDLYYLGRDYISKLTEIGLIKHPLSNNDYAVGIIGLDGDFHNSCFWRTEDINATGNNMEAFTQVLISVFVNELRERYE